MYEVHFLTDVFGDPGYFERYCDLHEAEVAAEREAAALADAYPGIDDDRWGGNGWLCRDGWVTVSGWGHLPGKDDGESKRFADALDWEEIEDGDPCDPETGTYRISLEQWRRAVRDHAVWVQEVEDD